MAVCVYGKQMMQLSINSLSSAVGLLSLTRGVLHSKYQYWILDDTCPQIKNMNSKSDQKKDVEY